MNPKFQGPQHDKKPFVRLRSGGARCIVTEADAADFLADADDPSEYTVERVLMSQAEVDALPEFTGF